MYYDFEKTVLVNETKGLLGGLERQVKEAKYNLAFDNLEDLINELNQMRMMINRIETKISEQIENDSEDEELF